MMIQKSSITSESKARICETPSIVAMKIKTVVEC
jgi:hypothetical protein